MLELLKWLIYALLLILQKSTITLSSPLNKIFADSSLVHGTLALLLFSHHSVVQVKGNNDDDLMK
jgi:hypothetical protein